MTKFAQVYLAELQKFAKPTVPLGPWRTPPGMISRMTAAVGKSPTLRSASAIGGRAIGWGLVGGQAADKAMEWAGLDQPMDAPRLKQFGRTAVPGLVGGLISGRSPAAALAGAAITSGSSAFSRLSELTRQQAELAKPSGSPEEMAKFLKDNNNAGPKAVKHLYDREAFDQGKAEGTRLATPEAKAYAIQQLNEATTRPHSPAVTEWANNLRRNSEIAPAAPAPTSSTASANIAASLKRYGPWLAGGVAAGGILAWAKNLHAQRAEEARKKRHPLADRYPHLFGNPS